MAAYRGTRGVEPPKPKKETVKKNATEKLVEQLTLFDLDF